MDVVLGLSKKEFPNKEAVDSYFLNQLPNEDKNYFYSPRKIRKIEKDDSIYFSYMGKIIAQAKYCGEYMENIKRHPKFKHGYKLENIRLISNPVKYDSLIINGRNIIYIDDEKKIHEIERVLSKITTNDGCIYPDEADIKDDKFPEGWKKQVTVNAFERNPKARQKCIDAHGVKCKICGFDFEKFYGDIGKNFIHVHHIKPLSEINDKYEVDPINDLIPVCPNCHAMIHRKIPAYNIDEVKKFIKKSETNS